MKNSQLNGVENTLTLFGFHTDDKLYKKHAQILAKCISPRKNGQLTGDFHGQEFTRGFHL